MAGGEGFEPSLSEPESDVLPLDDPPKPWKSLLEHRLTVKVLESGMDTFGSHGLRMTRQRGNQQPVPTPSITTEEYAGVRDQSAAGSVPCPVSP